jgi:hypothetical protein
VGERDLPFLGSHFIPGQFMSVPAANKDISQRRSGDLVFTGITLLNIVLALDAGFRVKTAKERRSEWPVGSRTGLRRTLNTYLQP